MTTIFLKFTEGIQLGHKSLSWNPNVDFYLISDTQRKCASMVAPPGYHPYSSLVPRDPGYIHTPSPTTGLWTYISQQNPLCGSSSSKTSAPKHTPLWEIAYISPIARYGGSHSSAPALQCDVILVTAMSHSLQSLPRWLGPRDRFLLSCKFPLQGPNARESNLQQMVPGELQESLK